MPEGYQGAVEDAWRALMTKDLERQAGNAGGSFDRGAVTIRLLDRRCVVDAGPRTVVIDGRGADPGETLLVLHYLANAAEIEPSGRLVSYRQLPGGSVYYPAFRDRVTDVIGTAFDRDPQAVIDALKGLGAVRGGQGDASFVVSVLPKLPVTIILWRGDEEVPGAASVLFDDTAPRFLHVEDLAAVGTLVADRVVAR
jgi:hypothetical protein